MSVCPILQVPDARLHQRAIHFRTHGSKAKSLLHDLADTMNYYPGCVGLAAQQIGRMYRAIVIDTRRYRKKVSSSGLIMMTNPKVINAVGAQQVREGCLSIPEFTGNVVRPTELIVEGINIDGDLHRVHTEGFEAIVFQHELDHLDGCLFLDRVHSLKTDIFRRKKFLH